MTNPENLIRRTRTDLERITNLMRENSGNQTLIMVATQGERTRNDRVEVHNDRIEVLTTSLHRTFFFEHCCT